MKKISVIILFLITINAMVAIAAPTVYPLRVTLSLSLNSAPANDVFSTFLVFQNYDETALNIQFDFSKKNELEYEAVVDSTIQTELDKFILMCTDAYRSYWDQMHLKNIAGTTSLAIEHIFLEIRYNGGAGNKTIPVLDWDINRVLASGNSSIDLNTYALHSRSKWVTEEVERITGIKYTYDINTQPALLAAIRDMGKCGSSGAGDDEYHDNPKYGIASALCSEFTSWYYANEGTAFGKKIFKDINNHTSLINLFDTYNRRYNYNLTTKQFEHNVTNDVYHPQPGDYIRRDDVPGDGHSMILAGWNEVTNMAAVVNGPWPVTIRSVNVDSLQSGAHEMQIGMVNEMTNQNEVVVYFKDEGIAEANLVKPRIYLQNLSSRPISDVECYYYITVDPGKAVEIDEYYVPSGIISLEQISTTLYRIKYDFSGVVIPANGVMPHTDGIVIGLHYSDWSVWDCSDDPSYINTDSFVVNTNMSVLNTQGVQIN